MKKTFLYRLMFMMFILSCAVVLGVSLYSRSLVGFLTNEMESNIEARLKEVSKMGASLVTAEELALYREPQDMNLPGYQALRRKLLDFAAATDVIYVYYLRGEGSDKMQFIVDNDFDETTRVGLDTPPSDVALVPGLGEALLGRVSSPSLGSYMAGWEGLLSAYAPVFDARGQVAAVCGADINDEMIVSAKRRENMFRILQIAAVVVVFASGILCLAGYSREARFAREANIFKSKFLSSLGHEMRSPLAAMSANAQLAAELLAADMSNAGAARGEEITKEIRGALEAVSQEAGRLARMSSAAVTLGAEQSESGRFGEKSGLDIARLVATMCEIYRPMIEHRGNRLVADIPGGGPDDPIRVYGNTDELSEVLVNFISNANEHTRDGEIRVRASCEAGTVTVMVSDDGCGMEAGVLPGIFERRPRKRASGKTGGIGLSICREIVEGHDGQIGIESEPGKGTRIFFRLPVMDKATGSER